MNSIFFLFLFIYQAFLLESSFFITFRTLLQLAIKKIVEDIVYEKLSLKKNK